MPTLKLKIPVPKLSFRAVQLTFDFKWPRPRLPRVRVARQLYYSVGLHVLLLLTGAFLQYISEHGRPQNVEIEVELAAVGPVKEVNLANGLSEPHDTIQVPGKNTSSGLSNLLHQASAGLSARASGVQKSPQVESDLSRLAQNIGRDLLANAVAGLPEAQGNALSSQPLERSATVPLEKIERTNKVGVRPMSVLEKEEIRKAIVAHEDAFRACHEKALLIDSGVSGQATMIFGVAGSGQVSDSHILFEGSASSGGKQALETCLRGESLALHFPASVAGSEIRFSLVLK